MTHAGSQLGAACTLLGEMEDVITTAQAAGRIAAVLLGDEMEQRFSLGGYEVTASNARANLGQMLLDAGLVAPPEPPPPASETHGAPSDRRRRTTVLSRW